MSELTEKQRLEAMKIVGKIASSAAQNANVESMVEFQEELIERLYKKITHLIVEESTNSNFGPMEDEGAYDDD